MDTHPQRQSTNAWAAVTAGALALLPGGCVQWPEEYANAPGAVTRRPVAAQPTSRTTQPRSTPPSPGSKPLAATPPRPTPSRPSALQASTPPRTTTSAARPTPLAPPTQSEQGNGVTYIARVATGTGNNDNEPETAVSQVSFARVGADFDPDVSRDGRLLTFASTQHQSSPDIYVKSVESRVVTQLTSDPAQDVMPKFSPDGSKIAFASDRAGNWDIYVMPTTGGGAVRVTESAANELHPSWSPDGTLLVYSRMGEVSGQWEMWVSDALNSGTAHFLGYGLFPEWCPRRGTGEGGADKILFQRGRQRDDHAFSAWTIDFRDGRSGSPTEVASTAGAACINPAWSPDGRWIAFSIVPTTTRSDPGEHATAELWMADLNGSARIRLAGSATRALMPSWGPDGRVFFASDRTGIENIWSVNAQEAVRLAGSMVLPQGMATVPADPEQDPDR